LQHLAVRTRLAPPPRLSDALKTLQHAVDAVLAEINSEGYGDPCKIETTIEAHRTLLWRRTERPEGTA
jgi:hypothetical protein